MWRRLVAALGHAPGLWIVYREPLPTELRRPNAVAIALTLVVIASAAGLAPEGTRGLAAIGAWAVAHALWGAYLFLRLPPAA